MDIYLAGGISANLKPLLQRIFDRGGGRMIVALAGTFSRPWRVEQWYDAAGLLTNNTKAQGSRHGGKKESILGRGRAMEGRRNLYLAGVAPWREEGIYNPIIEREAGVKCHLAGMQGKAKTFILESDGNGIPKRRGVHILESFYYADEFTEKMIPYYGEFLLDSGAFTLFTDGKKGRGIIWEEYVDKYADFIKRNKVRHFFELDIDKIIGGDKVLALRRRLEKKVGAQCIPVWHKFRGKDNFLRMCREYKYVAIGGIVSKEITPDEYRYFPWFINQAHKAGAKIHGLGFTALASLPKYHFDSVDSTAWTTGNRFGAVYYFDGKTMRKHGKGEGQRLKDSRAVAINNFNEWVKFQKYAETHL